MSLPSSSSNSFQSLNKSSPVNNLSTATSITATTSTNNDNNGGDLSKDLDSMEEDLKEVNKYFWDKIQKLRTSGGKTELDKLGKTIGKLKSHISSSLIVHSLQNPWVGRSNINGSSSNQAYVNKEAPAAGIREIFFRLSPIKQVSLLCLLKFPENAILKKRLIVYWWIGLGILSNDWMTEEDFGNELFNEHIKAGFFIKSISEKRNLTKYSYEIPPMVRSTLTFLAERPEFRQYRDDFLSQPNLGSATLYDKPEQVSNIKAAKILHLGSWQSLASKHHIEVENIKIFDGLKNMKLNLTFLSLRGISLITELPGFISELDNLKILDLRACYNLESLPDGIGSLQKLTHLDMSECYFLEHMPKALASLRLLQVLKGFFIGNSHNISSSSSSSSSSSCTLGDLAQLPILRKLNIYTSVKDFPTDNELKHLRSFRALKKLTISWGGCSLLVGEETVLTSNSQEQFPSTLKKLDLQCVPWTSAPSWLNIQQPISLQKLYIRGGHLRNLPNFSSVEELRLKYLGELKMDWERKASSFPKLNYLEIVECPKITRFRHKNGVWMKSDEETFPDIKMGFGFANN